MRFCLSVKHAHRIECKFRQKVYTYDSGVERLDAVPLPCVPLLSFFRCIQRGPHFHQLLRLDDWVRKLQLLLHQRRFLFCSFVEHDVATKFFSFFLVSRPQYVAYVACVPCSVSLLACFPSHIVRQFLIIFQNLMTHADNTYILYYICPLHTFYFLMVYVVMRIGRGINRTKWQIR